MSQPGRNLAIVAVLLLFTIAAPAQQSFDRSKIHLRASHLCCTSQRGPKTSLANGAELIVSEKHDLPLVAFVITFQGGTYQAEPAARRGLAGITASMMNEGTKTRDGEALSNALQLLGTSINVNVGGEGGSMGFQSTTSKFPQALEILADMLVNPAFPAEALERLRAQRLVALTQAKDQPGSIASRVFPKILYGSAHPFGQNVTEESLKAITRDDVVAFHKAYFQPGRALVSVVGDVNSSSVKSTVEKALGRVAKRRREAHVRLSRPAGYACADNLPRR
jgi:zinc protease